MQQKRFSLLTGLIIFGLLIAGCVQPAARAAPARTKTARQAQPQAKLLRVASGRGVNLPIART